MLIWRKSGRLGVLAPFSPGDPDRDHSRFRALAGGQYRPWMTLGSPLVSPGFADFWAGQSGPPQGLPALLARWRLKTLGSDETVFRGRDVSLKRIPATIAQRGEIIWACFVNGICEWEEYMKLIAAAIAALYLGGA
jgi:hypothetical protein